MITVIGKHDGVKKYAGRVGYNVQSTDNWTQEKNNKWLSDAVIRGDEFLLVGSLVTGVYKSEIELLLHLLGIARQKE